MQLLYLGNCSDIFAQLSQHKLAAKYNNRIITLANGHVASDTAHPEVAQEYEEWLAARQNDDEYEYED